MSAVNHLRAMLALITVAIGGPAGGVGLGPLTKQGLTDGPAKAFYLTLLNPYQGRTAFAVYAIGVDDETPQARVRLPRAPIALGSKASRRLMIIATGLEPGETYAFRVCAEKSQQEEEQIHARVCSRIIARRVPARA